MSTHYNFIVPVNQKHEQGSIDYLLKIKAENNQLHKKYLYACM